MVEDSVYTIEYLQKNFNLDVAELVDGVTKLNRIKELSNMRHSVADEKAESLRKMFLAMVEDIRVVLIKLSDRVHNMRTLEGHPEHKRRRIARETLEIFAPLANRLEFADKVGVGGPQFSLSRTGNISQSVAGDGPEAGRAGQLDG